MASSGIRLGAWGYLKWGHVSSVEKDGEIVAGRLRVYADEEDEYFTFISLEAWNELSKWIKYRQDSGEVITSDSWLMRNLWDVTKPNGTGLACVPKQLKPDGIKRLMERAIWAQGLRKKLAPNKKRHEFQANHSYRKWFKTRCEMSGMKPINIEILMNHSVGISDSYYRATEKELLHDYLHAVEYLSIDSNETILAKTVEELKVKSRENVYILEGKLSKKENEMKAMKLQIDKLMQWRNEVKEYLKYPEKLAQISSE
jgi:hypothetical protein